MDRDLMAPRHGTPWSFRNGCRCDDCRQASLGYYRACRARKRAELGLPPFVRFPGRTCGLRSTYVHGCRCDDCRRAETTYRRKYRARKRA
jgi:hypothetical protein